MLIWWRKELFISMRDIYLTSYNERRKDNIQECGKSIHRSASINQYVEPFFKRVLMYADTFISISYCQHMMSSDSSVLSTCVTATFVHICRQQEAWMLNVFLWSFYLPTTSLFFIIIFTFSSDVLIERLIQKNMGEWTLVKRDHKLSLDTTWNTTTITLAVD